MPAALKGHDGNVSIIGRPIINLEFADGTDAFVEKEQELEPLS